MPHMHYVVIIMIIMIIVMLTVYYFIMSHATLILYHQTSMLTLHTSFNFTCTLVATCLIFGRLERNNMSSMSRDEKKRKAKAKEKEKTRRKGGSRVLMARALLSSAHSQGPSISSA